MFQKKFKCLGEADEFDTIHRKSGHFFSTVRYDFADIIVGVAGDGRGRTIGRWFVEFAQEAVVLVGYMSRTRYHLVEKIKTLFRTM